MSKFDFQYDLVIGLPTTGIVDWRFASSLMSLILPQRTRVIWQVKSMIDTARNNIVDLFLKEPAKYLFMCDDDMIFEPDIIERLMEHNVDIVGGLAFKRRPDYQPCVYRQNQDDKQYYPILPEVFQEVDVVGTGGILINLDVFKKLKYPWFSTFYDADNIHWSVDFDFCIKAKKAGFKIFVDPKVELGHLGDSEIVNKNTFLKQTTCK
jgi:GT2 family glycosyltransferase